MEAERPRVPPFDEHGAELLVVFDDENFGQDAPPVAGCGRIPVAATREAGAEFRVGGKAQNKNIL